MLGIPRSTYYSFGYKKPSKTAIEREILKQEIQSIYDDSNGIYGAPKIHKILSKKFKHHTTKVKIEHKDNILNQDFLTNTINEKWVGDITYIQMNVKKWLEQVKNSIICV